MLAAGKPTLRKRLSRKIDHNIRVTARFSDSNHAFNVSIALRLLALRFLSNKMKEIASLTHTNGQLMRITKIGKG
jgi:hypothetical protein